MDNGQNGNGSIRPVERYDVGHVQEVIRQAHVIAPDFPALSAGPTCSTTNTAGGSCSSSNTATVSGLGFVSLQATFTGNMSTTGARFAAYAECK